MKDVKLLFIADIGEDTTLVILLNLYDMKVIPIYVGNCEGKAIYINARRQKHPRPLTYELMNNLIMELGSKVREVRIDALEGSTYHAQIVLGNGVKEIMVDSRASDAIALALAVDVPILVDETVIKQMGISIESDPEWVEKYKAFGNSLVNEIEKEKRERGFDLTELSNMIKHAIKEMKEKYMKEIVKKIVLILTLFRQKYSD